MAHATRSVHTVASAIPSHPLGHGMVAHGSAAVTRAIPAIALLAIHASPRNGRDTHGNGVVTSAKRPAIVASGASGSASAFAGIP